MPSLSSLLATGLFPPSPIAQWPPPPNTVCPEAISGLSERQRFDHWLPVRVVFDADLARTLDANLRDAVAQAEAAAIAAGRETDIISAETAEEVRTCLQDASKRLPSYRENQIQARFNSVVDAALLLVDPLHNLFDEPVPPALIVDGPADIPSVLIQPDALPGDELFERKLRLEADVLVREEERNPSDLAGHGIWLTMEVKVPEAQRPPGQGSAGGIHQRLETFLRSNPDVAIDQIETAILDEPARTELLKVTPNLMSTQRNLTDLLPTHEYSKLRRHESAATNTCSSSMASSSPLAASSRIRTAAIPPSSRPSTLSSPLRPTRPSHQSLVPFLRHSVHSSSSLSTQSAHCLRPSSPSQLHCTPTPQRRTGVASQRMYQVRDYRARRAAHLWVPVREPSRA